MGKEIISKVCFMMIIICFTISYNMRSRKKQIKSIIEEYYVLPKDGTTVTFNPQNNTYQYVIQNNDTIKSK